MKKIIILILLTVLNINTSYAAEKITIVKPCSKSSLGKIKNGLECKSINKLYRWVRVEEIKDPLPIVDVPKPIKNTIDISGISVNYIISDNASKRNYQQYLAALNGSIEFWYPVFNKSNINVILFTEHDGAWVDQKQRQLMGNFKYGPNDSQSLRLKQHGCHIGGFYLPNIILACINDQETNNLGKYMLLPHEYVHLVGMTSFQISNFPLGSDGRMRPCWVEEGMATFYGMKSASLVDKNFEKNKKDFWLYRNITADLKSKQSIISTMVDLEKDMRTCNKVQDAYYLGSISFEKLYNDYGHEKILNFNKLFYSGINWKTAFSQTFNMDVNDFYDIIANEIVKS